MTLNEHITLYWDTHFPNGPQYISIFEGSDQTQVIYRTRKRFKNWHSFGTFLVENKQHTKLMPWVSMDINYDNADINVPLREQVLVLTNARQALDLITTSNFGYKVGW